MSVTLDRLKKVLDQAEFNYFDLDDEDLGLVVVHEGARYNLVASLAEAGEYVGLFTVGLANCPNDHANLDEVLMILAEANHQFKAVQFGRDPADGDIQATVALPLEDNEDLTVEQVREMMSYLIPVCGRVAPEVRRALESEPPGGSSGRVRDSQAKGKGRSNGRPAGQPPASPSGSAASPEPSSREPMPRTAAYILAFGVLLLGLAALLGVIYLFFHS